MKKPLKVAAWSAIISIVLGLLMLPFGLLAENYFGAYLTVSIFTSLIGVVLSVLFINGFLVIGRKYKNKLLVVMAWIGIVLAVLGMIAGIAVNIFLLTSNVTAQADYGNLQIGNDLSEEELAALAPILLGVLIAVWLGVSIIFGAYTILWGIGVLRLQKNNIEYAKPTGILLIISGATYIILVGFLVRIVAWIFEIILMFKASEKLEGKR